MSGGDPRGGRQPYAPAQLQVGLLGLDESVGDRWRRASRACDAQARVVSGLVESEALARSDAPFVLVAASSAFSDRLADPSDPAFRRSALVVVTRDNEEPRAWRHIAHRVVFESTVAEDLTPVLRDALDEAVSRHDDWRCVEEFNRHEASLNEDERRVFHAVIAGRLNKQIASDMGVSVRTIEQRRRRVFEKMHVDSAVPLAAMTARVGTLESLARRNALPPPPSAASQTAGQPAPTPSTRISPDLKGFAAAAI